MHWVLLFAACLATIIAFSPGLRAPFQFDDIESIAENRSIRSLATAWTPPRQIAVSGRPIVNLSLAMNKIIADAGNPSDAKEASRSFVFGVRVVNLAIHVACGLLIYGLVLVTARGQTYSESIALRANGLALFVAALWMIHPMQTEVVHYAIQRTESLMALCFLATLYASARAWDAVSSVRRMAWLCAGVASALVGMGCKEVMIVVPLIVVLYDRAFRFKSWRDVLTRANPRLPYYAALIATGVWAVVLAAGRPRSDSVGFGLGITPFDYLKSQGWAIWHYLRLVVWPVDLSIDYGPARVMGNATLIGVAGLAVGAFATLFAWRRAATFGWMAFLASWFYLILGPSSSFIPIITEIAAERRMYLPLVAVLVGVGVAFLLTMSRYPRAERPLWAGAALVFTVLAVLTMRRSAVFNDLEQLWREAMHNVPWNARAPDNLATVILQEDSSRSAEAVTLLQQSLERDSTSGFALYKLGVLALNGDRVQEARSYLERALSLNPRHPEALAEMAHVSLRTGDTAAAIDQLARSVAAAPNDTVFVQLGQLYGMTGRGEEALTAYRRALAINPRRTELATYLSATLIENGRAGEAVPVLEALLRSRKNNPGDLALLAVAYAGAGRARDASVAAANVFESGTSDGEALKLAGRALLEVSDSRAAEVVLTRAVQVSAAPAEALTLLAAAQLGLGKRDAAVSALRRALKEDPEYQPARAALSRIR